MGLGQRFPTAETAARRSCWSGGQQRKLTGYEQAGEGLRRHRSTVLVSPDDGTPGGVAPSAMPVQQPTVYDLVINQRAAHALGITVPHTLLIRANEIIP